MSAGTMSPPAKTKQASVDEGRQHTGPTPVSPTTPAPTTTAKPPAKTQDMQRRNVMQERMPRIISRLSKAEAHEARRTWKSPVFQGGTPVFFRPERDDREYPGTLMREANGSWSVLAQIPGQGFVEKLSCRWYDHELDNAADVCDPLSAHSSNGTFRLTPFAMMITELYTALVKDQA